MLADMYNTFFQRSGFQANCFTDPLQALEHYKNNAKKYSLVITDLSTPDISAIDLVNQISLNFNNVKIFLITAWDINNTYTKETKIEQAKIDKIIQKPIRLSKLREIIDDVLEQ